MRATRRATFGAFLTLISAAAPAALTANDIAVIVNEADSSSVAIGDYYTARRGIPPENVIRVDVPVDKPVIASAAFRRLRDDVQRRTPAHVQAYALAWTAPERVNCMSITTAFAMGYAERYCAKRCRATAPSPYYRSDSGAPHTDFGIRPTMMIAARGVANAKLLIDRGIQSDGTRPVAAAYFVITPDKARNVRTPSFHAAKRAFGKRMPISIVRANGIRDRFDIMFYFTGTSRVPYLDTVGFLPGAIADHLTSAGGRLTSSPQMSALEWLEAGATGSYGTVVEPCNFPQKFPDPAIVMHYYLGGDTLIEAYWKSVVWPGQGVFIGEPLARPYGRAEATADDGHE